jgi:hypothetical protein
MSVMISMRLSEVQVAALDQPCARGGAGELAQRALPRRRTPHRSPTRSARFTPSPTGRRAAEWVRANLPERASAPVVAGGEVALTA